MNTSVSLRDLLSASHRKFMIVTAAASVIGLAAVPAQAGVSWAALQPSPSIADDESSDIRPHDGKVDRTGGFVVATRGPH